MVVLVREIDAASNCGAFIVLFLHFAKPREHLVTTGLAEVLIR
jgi:hypothetical protein